VLLVSSGRATGQVPADALTLFARANAALKLGNVSSMEKVLGSPELVLQVTVSWPPDVHPEGVLIEKAEAKGRAPATKRAAE